MKTYKLSSRHSEDFDPLFDSVGHAKSPYWSYKGVQNGYDYIQSLVKSDQFVFAFILPSIDCEIWEECKNVEFILEVPEEDIHFFVDEETWDLVVRHNADPRNALKKKV